MLNDRFEVNNLMTPSALNLTQLLSSFEVFPQLHNEMPFLLGCFSPTPPCPQSLENASLHSVTMDLLNLDISRKWKHILGDLLCLASFT